MPFNRVEPIVLLLTYLLMFLIVCLFASEIWFKNDAQFFQVVSNMASGVLGALLGIITGKNVSKSTETHETTTITDKQV